MNAIAANINGQSMNFGIQTGDFVDNGGNLGQWNEILMALQELRRHPVVQVMGNHEYITATCPAATPPACGRCPTSCITP